MLTFLTTRAANEIERNQACDLHVPLLFAAVGFGEASLAEGYSPSPDIERIEAYGHVTSEALGVVGERLDVRTITLRMRPNRAMIIGHFGLYTESGMLAYVQVFDQQVIKNYGDLLALDITFQFAHARNLLGVRQPVTPVLNAEGLVFRLPSFKL